MPYADPEQAYAWHNRRYARTLAERLRITVEEVFDLWTHERCDLCGATLGPGRPDIDHCHHCGRVRGVLCRTCNNGLGLLGDHPQGLTMALTYLEKHHVRP